LRPVLHWIGLHRLARPGQQGTTVGNKDPRLALHEFNGHSLCAHHLYELFPAPDSTLATTSIIPRRIGIGIRKTLRHGNPIATSVHRGWIFYPGRKTFEHFVQLQFDVVLSVGDPLRLDRKKNQDQSRTVSSRNSVAVGMGDRNNLFDPQALQPDPDRVRHRQFSSRLFWRSEMHAGKECADLRYVFLFCPAVARLLFFGGGHGAHLPENPGRGKQEQSPRRRALGGPTGSKTTTTRIVHKNDFQQICFAQIVYKNRKQLTNDRRGAIGGEGSFRHEKEARNEPRLWRPGLFVLHVVCRFVDLFFVHDHSDSGGGKPQVDGFVVCVQLPGAAAGFLELYCLRATAVDKQAKTAETIAAKQNAANNQLDDKQQYKRGSKTEIFDEKVQCECIFGRRGLQNI